MRNVSKLVTISIRATLGLLACTAGIALAQERFPDKPIKILVPSTPGSTLDIIFRQVAERLSPQLGQPVIVENRAGASGIIAYDAVAKSKPDGYTLAAVQASFVSNALLYKAAKYDMFKDFAPVAMVARSPMVLVARGAFPPNTIAEVRDLARAKPGTLTYASINGANQMNSELVSKELKIDMRNIPYRDAGQALTDVLSGTVDMHLMAYSTISSQLRSGKLKAFVTLGKGKLDAAPATPSATDLGLPVDINTWAALLGPAGTPEPVVAALHAATNKVVEEPALRERLLGVGFTPSIMTRAAFVDYMKAEAEIYVKLAKELGIKPE